MGTSRHKAACLALVLTTFAVAPGAFAQRSVVDLPARPRVTQRFLLIAADKPRAAAILFAGGEGGLLIDDSGTVQRGTGNFLIRSAELFVARGITVALIDTPSDHREPPFLDGFRESSEHADDVKAVIGWLRDKTKLPVWLIGTSRGTQSAAAVATRLKGSEGADGIVLTSTILVDRRGTPVPQMSVDRLAVPVLVVHHEQDTCRTCPYSEIPRLMRKLAPLPRKQLLTFRGGRNEGPACEARAYHGYNGIEDEVVEQIVAWMTAS